MHPRKEQNQQILPSSWYNISDNTADAKYHQKPNIYTQWFGLNQTIFKHIQFKQLQHQHTQSEYEVIKERNSTETQTHFHMYTQTHRHTEVPSAGSPQGEVSADAMSYSRQETTHMQWHAREREMMSVRTTGTNQ